MTPETRKVTLLSVDVILFPSERPSHDEDELLF